MSTKIRKQRAALCFLLVFVLLLAPNAAEAGFTQRTYSLCSDMVYSYRMNQMAAYDTIRRDLDELKAENAKFGAVWEELMNYWIYTNYDIEVYSDLLPDGLPQDDSLCIVVLGYQLLPDGTMTEELLGRCRTALQCLEQYPNALLAVTGGGTAADNRRATEADCMAEWLADQGVDPARILIENRSQTTAENARFTCTLLREEHPEIRELAIVSSDYHVPLGCLMFRAYELLYAYENETEALPILAYAGFLTGVTEPAEPIATQGADLWSIAESILE